MNLVSFVVSLCVILLAVSVSDGSFVKQMNDITKRLDTKLADVLSDVEVDYTPIEEDATYSNGTRFNPQGMAGLYNITGIFMDWTIPVNLIPSGKFCNKSIKIRKYDFSIDIF